ncbi:MAG: diaminopimelate decarboxylase [Planctomycetota bacterium]
MDGFEYHDGVLYGENVALTAVARRFGTPTYVYSRRAFISHYERLTRAFAELHPKICFSVKSCHNLHILRLLRDQGTAFDVVSGGEIRRAIEAGAHPGDIVFAGVGKTDEEIALAIELGVGCFNVESVAELEVLAAHAERARRTVHAALRANPDVDALTHPYTTTGKRENKFGIDVERLRELFVQFKESRWLKVSGVHMHIGSPVNTPAPYVQALTRVCAAAAEVQAHGVQIDLINLGGGYGVCYQDDDAPLLEAYAQAVLPILAGRGWRVLMEPGRSIAANAGILLTKALYVKQGRERRFVVVDAAMTDLLRPALYGAYHFIWPVAPGSAFEPQGHSPTMKLPGAVLVDVVGPVCESGDFLGKDRWLPPIQRGDLLAVFSAGAYGSVMSSHYNSRPRAPEVLVEGDCVRLIRRRETYDDLVAAEREV